MRPALYAPCPFRYRFLPTTASACATGYTCLPQGLVVDICHFFAPCEASFGILYLAFVFFLCYTLIDTIRQRSKAFLDVWSTRIYHWSDHRYACGSNRFYFLSDENHQGDPLLSDPNGSFLLGTLLLIGANTAAVVNFMAVISCTCYYIRNRRGSRSLWVPIVFISLNWITGILTWDGWISLLLLLGLTANGVGLAINTPQAIRKFYLIKAPFCLAYNALVFSWGGVIYEIATLTCAVIALIRDRTPKAPAAQRTDADEKV